ncbi:helix-turn-helix domain-containing protein [Streptomyces sp. NPDC044989]|uniref:helix-turn-helix domain-containing protein n=2 Tax=Streptomyces TaxID=1883 RepID=UPI0033D5F3FD
MRLTGRHCVAQQPGGSGRALLAVELQPRCRWFGAAAHLGGFSRQPKAAAAAPQSERNIADDCRLGKPAMLRSIDPEPEPVRHRITGAPFEVPCAVAGRDDGGDLRVAVTDRFMDVKETAAYLNVSVSWLYKNAARSGLVMYKFGVGMNSKIRFNVSDVEAWVKQQRVSGV